MTVRVVKVQVPDPSSDSVVVTVVVGEGGWWWWLLLLLMAINKFDLNLLPGGKNNIGGSQQSWRQRLMVAAKCRAAVLRVVLAAANEQPGEGRSSNWPGQGECKG